MGTAIQPFTGTTEAKTYLWVDMPPADRRRTAAKAANEKDPEALVSLLTAHVRLMSASGRTSEATIRAYRRGVAVWLEFCAAGGVNVLRPTQDQGALFRIHLQERELTPGSCRVYMAAVKALYRALRWTKATEDAPLADVKAPRETVEPWDKRQPYSPEEVERLLSAADRRDRVMVLLGAHAGLRVAETASLAWSGVDLESSTITVTGKGGKTRRVPVSSTLSAALKRFSSHLGRGPVLLIKPPAIRARMRRLTKRAGVPYRGFHSLRHHSGTQLSRAGLTDRDIARVLGHANTKTVEVYSKWSSDSARAVLAEW